MQLAGDSAAELCGQGEVVGIGTACGDRPTVGAVRVLADERGGGYDVEPCRAGQRCQLRKGVFVGAVAVYDYGGCVVALQAPQPLGGQRREMTSVYGYGYYGQSRCRKRYPAGVVREIDIDHFVGARAAGYRACDAFGCAGRGEIYGVCSHDVISVRYKINKKIEPA